MLVGCSGNDDSAVRRNIGGFFRINPNPFDLLVQPPLTIAPVIGDDLRASTAIGIQEELRASLAGQSGTAPLATSDEAFLTLLGADDRLLNVRYLVVQDIPAPVKTSGALNEQLLFADLPDVQDDNHRISALNVR